MLCAQVFFWYFFLFFSFFSAKTHRRPPFRPFNFAAPPQEHGRMFFVPVPESVNTVFAVPF